MTSQDESAKLMQDLIKLMIYLRPSLDALLQVLDKGNVNAMEKHLALQGLLQRIHITMGLFVKELESFSKTEEARMKHQESLQAQQQMVEQAVATLNKRLLASEEKSKSLEELMRQMIQLLR